MLQPVRSALLLVFVSSLATAASSAPGPQLRAVLGQPDLAAPARMVELTFLDAGDLLAVDATGTAQLWDMGRGLRRGLVFGPVVLTPDGLRSAPPGRGCLLDGPLVALSGGWLAHAAQGQLHLCDVSGHAPDMRPNAPALTDDGTALAFSPNGTEVAEGTAFGEVVRVPLGGGQALHLQAHEGRVLALRFGTQGELLTAGADGVIRAFDAAGRPLLGLEAMPAQLRAHPTGCEGETPTVASFSSDGTLVVLGTVAGDGLEACPTAAMPAKLRLLDLTTGTWRWELQDVQASAVTFAPDGSLAVAVALRPGEPGDANPSVVVRLDPATGAQLDRPSGHQAPLTVLRFSKDGASLLSADAAGTWKRWAMDNLRETFSASPTEGAILDLRLTADQHILTQHEDDTVRLWGPDGSLLTVLVAPPKAEVAELSPVCRAEEEKTQAALASMRQRVSPLAVRDPGHYAGVTVFPELALSADGETLLAPVPEESCVSFSPNGCPSGCHRNYHLERVSLRTGRSVQSLPVEEELLGGCVPPAGAFVTRSERAGMNVWAASGTLTGQIGVVLGKVTACETTPDGRKMLVATARALSVWDAAAFSAPVQAVPRRAQAPGPVAFSPRGDLSVDVDGGELRLRHWPKGSFVARLVLSPHDDAPTAMAFTPDGQTLAVGTARGVIYLYALSGETQTADQVR